MARGTQLGDLILMFRGETGQSMAAGVGVQDEANVTHLLNRAQASLFAEWEWPTESADFDDPLAAGERYYAYPSGLDPDRVEAVWVKDTRVSWMPLSYGIDPEMFIQFDSDAGVRFSEVYRWQRYGTSQYEVWPIPDDVYTLRFRGDVTITKMVDKADTALLDDYLIVLMAAADYLDGRGDKAADAKRAAAARRLNAIKANLSGRGKPPTKLFVGEQLRTLRPGIDYIPRRSA